jgi:hypothetical protein
MSARRANRKLRLELLRARAAADRLDLALAMQDISDQVAPVRRAVDSIASVARALRGRGAALGWVATAGAALARGRFLNQALTGLAGRLRSGSTAGARNVAVSALAAAVVAMLIRRSRRSDRPAPKQPGPRSGKGELTAGRR